MNNISKFANSNAGQVVIIGAVVAIGLYYTKKAAAVAVDALDPTSANNLAYTGVNNIGEAITGKPFDLGGWIFDVVNGEGD